MTLQSTIIPSLKIVLCGEFGVGKTSIFRRFSTKSFTNRNDRQSTLGLDNFENSFQVDDKSLKLQLWDTGGMERVATVTSSYYKFSEAAILVFAFDNPSSFHVLPQYLLDVVTNAENAKIFLCGNKMDLYDDDKLNITDQEIETFCEQCHNIISGIYKISCKTNQGVEEMFKDIAKTLVNSNLQKFGIQSMERDGRIKLSTEGESSQTARPSNRKCYC